jgi:hypothetical protein
MKNGNGMTAKKTTTALGRHVYGVGVIAVALGCLAWGVFDPGQPVPDNFPHHIALAYAVGAFLFLAGAAIQWRRTAAWGAAALTVYYTLIVILLMYGPILLVHYREFGTYEPLAEQVGIAAAGLIVYAGSAEIAATLAARLIRLGQLAFGVCTLIWGGAHLVFMNLTAPLVPHWLPLTQVFWGYATAVGFFAAGIALLTGVQARLAAILLTAMLASFTLLVHVRMLLADHSSHFNWTELSANLVLVGAAWVVADSLARPGVGARA